MLPRAVPRGVRCAVLCSQDRTRFLTHDLAQFVEQQVGLACSPAVALATLAKNFPQWAVLNATFQSAAADAQQQVRGPRHLPGRARGHVNWRAGVPVGMPSFFSTGPGGGAAAPREQKSMGTRLALGGHLALTPGPGAPSARCCPAAPCPVCCVGADQIADMAVVRSIQLSPSGIISAIFPQGSSTAPLGLNLLTGLCGMHLGGSGAGGPCGGRAWV